MSTPSPASIFGTALEADPSVALPKILVHPKFTAGPVRKQQLVIELVGPRTVPAASILALLDAQWQNALGEPQVFVMAARDRFWRSLEPNDPSGAFDSIALAWDLIAPKGTMSGAAAQHLWNVAENLARQVGRRAMAMPVPDDIEPTVRILQDLRESLDIGVNFSVLPRGERGFPERDIWVACAALGLEMSAEGAFQWRSPAAEQPLFEVLPAGDLDRFSLGQVQSRVFHPGLGMGFSVPLCPEPKAALEGCFRAGAVLAQRLMGLVFDDEDQPVAERSMDRMRRDLSQAIGALNGEGFEPGSTEALKLFG